MARSFVAFVAFVSLCVTATPLFAQGQEDIILGKKTSEWLQILKTGKEVKLRQAALIALEVIGPKAPVVFGLIQALEKDAEPEIRRDVAATLGRMGTDAKGAAEALGHALRTDKADIVREAAARALGGRMAPQAIGQVFTLAKALSDPHAPTRVAAVETLRDLGDGAKPVLPQLKEMAAHKKSERFGRVYAIQIVSKLTFEAPDETLPLLLGILRESEAHDAVRLAAIDGIARFGPLAESAIKDLSALLVAKPKQESAGIRRASLVALARIGPKAVVAWPSIKSSLKDADSAVRHQAVRVAGSIAERQGEVVPALVEVALKDESTDTRLAALQELGQLGPIASSAVDALNQLAGNDVRASIREAATEALKKIKGSN